MSTAGPDPGAAMEELLRRSDAEALPFTWYEGGPEGRRISISVPRGDHDVAVDHFDAHPLLADGAVVPVEVRVRAGASWTSWPVVRTGGPRSRERLDELVGMDVGTAALRANGWGWRVCAVEPEAIVAADGDPARANVTFDETSTVVAVSVG